ncbi:dephospho-CoA kinase [Kaistia algarum]|uniref:dephospho-CoA kinase n=1 Tax=Kaistia algarum TaxID=2083279 RepID=UPI000CE77E42|nr:dephospho-CoA kinase [Kaistia algarum]MCX5513856.1 dephospho-CoA kinase [Kaistia algarum]PPE79285.1 dephospho-CoA kinase [Kaistia algarum]
MITIGLTGSIGMGKSTLGRFFAARGAPLLDADAMVHALYRGAAVDPVGQVFPDAIRDGAVDRALLSAEIARRPAALAELEAIVHPLVRAGQAEWLAKVRGAGHAFAVLDIPLLLETGGETRVDVVVVASAPSQIQRARVLARPGMSSAKRDAILARQMPDAEKRGRAHFVVDTGGALEAAERQVDDILRALAASAAARGVRG